MFVARFFVFIVILSVIVGANLVAGAVNVIIKNSRDNEDMLFPGWVFSSLGFAVCIFLMLIQNEII